MDELLTINQAALILKVHHLTIRRYIKEKKLKALKVGGNIRIPLNELRAFTENFFPHSQTARVHQPTHSKPFSFNDPLFRLKARGLSISKLEEK